MSFPDGSSAYGAMKRVRIWYGLLIALVVFFGVRLFYIQVIRYEHYKNAALSDQLREYTIPAERGIIEAHEGGKVVPLVLNQKLYALVADPVDVKQYKQDPAAMAVNIAEVLGGSASAYQAALTAPDTRYSVLAKKITEDQEKKIMAYKYSGLYAEEQDYRTYPQGPLAAQLLGFVDDNGQGQYGIEQALNQELAGTPGSLKAITDVNGVPLAASNDNVSKPAIAGDDVTLTIDLAMQKQMEKILQQEATNTKSKLLSAVIMDPNTGQIKAMANYPTYDPAHYNDVSDPSVFQNAAVTNTIEPGSIMKTLTTSAALDQGVIQPNTTFYDPAHWLIDGFNITDIEEDGGAREQSISTILSLSLNTGATWELMQMGGGQVNEKAITAWHDYMTKHFRLGHVTGVEQGNGEEASGYVPPADMSNPSIALRYANTAFGQGVSVTALQMAAALSSVINGGTYYKPTLIDQTQQSDGTTTTNKPKVVERHVVASQTGQDLIPLMENVVTTYLHEGFSYMKFSPDYLVGGKTGTAQLAQPGGGYYADKFNGTYLGFVGGDHPQYVIAVFNIEPNVAGYAGSNGGQPVFADLAHMLIDDAYVTPKSH